MKMHVVYADSNPANVLAFFKTREEAVIYQGAATVPTNLQECIVPAYDTLTITRITLA